MQDTVPTYRILAVCLGNICRSPLAEGLLKRVAKERGLPWEVDSAGTSGWHQGEAADPRSRAIAKKHNLNIDQQRSRKVEDRDFEAFDLILAMDHQNGLDLRRWRHSPNTDTLAHGLADQDSAKADSEKASAHIAEILDIAGLSETYGLDVVDPYHDDDGFQSVYDLLEQAANRLADQYEAGQLPNQNPDFG
ncbi:MAG: low molecular weight protein-tyrosine-phosphatase [Bacteroidota bacterium]